MRNPLGDLERCVFQIACASICSTWQNINIFKLFVGSKAFQCNLLLAHNQQNPGSCDHWLHCAENDAPLSNKKMDVAVPGSCPKVIHKHMFVHNHMHLRMRMHMHTPQTYKHTHTHAHAHTHIHVHIHKHICTTTYTQANTFVRTCASICTHTRH